MWEYYNTTPSYAVGGRIVKIAQKLGKLNIQSQAALIGKSNNELFKLLSKLAKAQKGGAALSEKESQKLVSLAQNYRRKNIYYKARKNEIAKELADKRLAAAANKTQPATAGVESKAAEEAKEAATNTSNGSTLSARWKKLKNWMNEHPAATIGVPLFAASGIGRDTLGGAWSLYSARPFSSDSEQPVKNVVTIDGKDIPITMSANGKFVVDTTGGVGTETSPADDIDAAIDSATATPDTPDTSTPAVPDIKVSDQSQQMINDLFAEDQWY